MNENKFCPKCGSNDIRFYSEFYSCQACNANFREPSSAPLNEERTLNAEKQDASERLAPKVQPVRFVSGSRRPESSAQTVIVKGVEIPFKQILILCVKVYLACILIGLVTFILSSLFLALFGAIVATTFQGAP